MATYSDELLHKHARECAAALTGKPDKKQMRFNEIIQAARDFYPSDILGGVSELVRSCDADDETLYVKGQPMWKALREQYAWMRRFVSLVG